MKLTSLADAAAARAADPVSGDLLRVQPNRLMTVPWTQVAVNPINPRDEVEGVPGEDDYHDLKSIATLGQLEPVAVVTRDQFLALYVHVEARDAEEAREQDRLHESVGDALYVVCYGSRRRLAVEHFGVPTLDIIIRPQLAESRQAFYAAAIEENIGRQQFNPIQEARALQRMIRECGGSAKTAAQQLRKSEAWVSSKIGLLKLTPGLQSLVAGGQITPTAGRELARLPIAEQEAAERRLAARARAVDSGRYTSASALEGADGEQSAPPARLETKRRLTVPLRDAEALAKVLRDNVPDEVRADLVRLLSVDGRP
jgi:ParB family transcriptional regulator, chromosome partitioning protein